MGSKKLATFSFKKQPRPTGLAAVGQPYQNVDIKHDKKVIGVIAAPNWHDGWHIRLTVLCDESVCACGWQWHSVESFATEDEARAYLKTHAAELVAMGLRHDEAVN